MRLMGKKLETLCFQDPVICFWSAIFTSYVVMIKYFGVIYILTILYLNFLFLFKLVRDKAAMKKHWAGHASMAKDLYVKSTPLPMFLLRQALIEAHPTQHTRAMCAI